MESRWEETNLSALSLDVSYGYTESATVEKVGPKFLRITDIQNGIVDWNLVPYCPIDKKKHVKYKLYHGDIVVARTGNSTGENFLFTGGEDAVYASYLIRFQIDHVKADPRFVWYTMRSPDWWAYVQSSKTGSAQAGANAKVLGGYPINLPPLAEQRAIAHILGALDDKVELNRRMNKTLEAMAQAMFKSWFVNFDPVIDNALTAGNEIPEELKGKADTRDALGDARKPLPEEIQKLFPSEFEHSEEMGWVPKGWKPRSVEDIMEVNPTVKLPKKTVAPFVDMKALPTTGYSVGGIIKKPYAGGAKFQNGDILLARITPCLENGKTAIADFLDGEQIGFGSTEFIVLRGKGSIKTPFAACLSRNLQFRDHCIQSMVGSSGRQRVQNACFSNFYLSLPEEQDLLDQFHLLTEGHFNQITKHSVQDRILTKLRDTLLPKLLSGEIRIPEAEKLLEGLK